MQLYEQIESLNIIKSVFLSVAVSVFFSGVRTGLALRNKNNLVHNSAAVFWLDQMSGVAAGLVAYALLHDWFGAPDKGLTHLAVIGVCAFSSAELLAVAKVGSAATRGCGLKPDKALMLTPDQRQPPRAAVD